MDKFAPDYAMPGIVIETVVVIVFFVMIFLTIWSIIVAKNARKEIDGQWIGFLELFQALFQSASTEPSESDSLLGNPQDSIEMVE